LANITERLVRDALKRNIKTAEQLHKLKVEYSVKYSIDPVSNVKLIEEYNILLAKRQIDENKDFLKLIRKRGVRSQSGIVSITVITKQFPCPGKCIFCPTEPKMPKSYLSNEPAVMRAILNNFNAQKQTENRLESLKKTGHFTNKVDVIVSGGTFSYYPKKYQTEFIKGIYKGLNGNSGKMTLDDLQKINETAENRCIGLSVETRPDHIDENELIRLRKLGVTKIEVGVQSLCDEVLRKNKRGHTVEQTKLALRLMKDAGFKVNCHMMPNLYGSNIERDFSDIRELFENPDYRPDWLKIYPCMVVPWSQLEKFYKNGDYKPYGDDDLIELIIKIKGILPEYVRLTRLYRDIPAPTIIAGSKLSNLRQIVHGIMLKRGLKCRCIRCREIKGQIVDPLEMEMDIKEFESSGGREFFVSFSEKKKDKICSLLRLRFSSYSLSGKKHFIKELEGAAIIREVHTYGEQIKVKSSSDGYSQHAGFGRKMIEKAEEISRNNNFDKIAVISGVGVREYYRKLGYHQEGTYMVKHLKNRYN